MLRLLNSFGLILFFANGLVAQELFHKTWVSEDLDLFIFEKKKIMKGYSSLEEYKVKYTENGFRFRNPLPFENVTEYIIEYLSNDTLILFPVYKNPVQTLTEEYRSKIYVNRETILDSTFHFTNIYYSQTGGPLIATEFTMQIDSSGNTFLKDRYYYSKSDSFFLTEKPARGKLSEIQLARLNFMLQRSRISKLPADFNKGNDHHEIKIAIENEGYINKGQGYNPPVIYQELIDYLVKLKNDISWEEYNEHVPWISE